MVEFNGLKVILIVLQLVLSYSLLKENKKKDYGKKNKTKRY